MDCSFPVRRRKLGQTSVNSSFFLSRYSLNLDRMSIPRMDGVYRSIFSLSSGDTSRGIQVTRKPLAKFTVYRLLSEPKVRWTGRFITLCLKVPPKPMLSVRNSGSIEQSIPARAASFSVMAENVEPVSTRKLIPLLA